MAEVKVYEVLGLCRCHMISRLILLPQLMCLVKECVLCLSMFQLSTYRGLQSCQSYGRQCSAKLGLFARPSIRPTWLALAHIVANNEFEEAG